MKMAKKSIGTVLVLALACFSCNMSDDPFAKRMNSGGLKQAITILPTVEKWVKSPVRNRLVIVLNRPITEIWALVGNPANMPKFSAGLDSVTCKTENGNCSQYTCYFKPIKKGEAGYKHTENILWHEINRGWASRLPEPNDMGFTDYLSMLTLEGANGKTKLTWSMTCNHEKAEMIETNKQGLKQAFEDIGKHLIAFFGGEVVENYVQK